MKYNIQIQKHSKKTSRNPLLKTAAAVLGALLITAMLLSCTACSREDGTGTQNPETTQNAGGENTPGTASNTPGADGTSAAAMISATAQPSDPAVPSGTPDAADASSTSADTMSASSTAAGAETAATAQTAAAETPEYRGLVVIDPGHQQYANTEQEPVGPGASETKVKVSGGTSGTATGVPEYELTLDIGLQLRDELLQRGYQVIMVRDSNEVDISNSERAEVANEADADVFIRLHANGSPDSGVTGAMTICQTPGNPYNGDLYQQSRALAEKILDSYIYKTGINRQYVWETDTMSGINWSEVPSTILEMGYMSNTGEDRSMQDDEMQQRMVEGIADGIDEYMEQFPPKERDETFFEQDDTGETSSGQGNTEEASSGQNDPGEISGAETTEGAISEGTEKPSVEESDAAGESEAEAKEGTEGPPEGSAAAEEN